MNPKHIWRLFLSLLCFYAGLLPAQKLDYSKHLVLEIDQQTVHLYADAEHTNEYYFVPYSGLFQFGKRADGSPEFLFMRYTADKDNVKGGLFHCLIEWKAEQAVLDQLQKQLRAAVPDATLKGAVPFNAESKFYVVSGTASMEAIITSGRAPVLSGFKVAVAMRLDAQASTLMYEQIERGANTDLSFVFEYKIPFQTTTSNATVEINWEKYRSTYTEFSRLMGTSTRPEQEGFRFLLANGTLSFKNGKEPTAESVDYVYAQGFLMKYFKDVQPGDTRANTVDIQQINLADTYSDFLLPLQISVNMGSWTKVIRNNPKCVASVNLNDPFFQRREVFVLLDFEAEKIFKENVANFVSITVQKNQENGSPFTSDVIFDKHEIMNGKSMKQIQYARGENHNWQEYKYKYSWSLRGITTPYPENPAWITSSEPVIAVPSPAQSVEIIVDASGDGFNRPELRSVILELWYNYFGNVQKDRVILRKTETGVGIATKTIFCDKVDPNIRYRFVFYCDNGKFQTDTLAANGENYFVPVLPEQLKNAVTAIVFTPPETGKSTSAANPAKPIQRTNKDYALFFAVSDYQSDATYPDLQNPVRDARAIAQELVQRYGFQAELVENPTRTQIKSKIEEYSKKFETKEYDPEGQLLIFFSGHGEFADGNGFFLPSDVQPGDLDATAIAYPTWRSRLDNIACKHLLVVIDACYSGTFDPNVAMRSGPMKRPGELSDAEKFYQEHLARTTRLFFASGGKEQTPDKSTFAKQLLEGLRVADTPHGLLTAGQLFELYIKPIRPVPLLGTFGKDEAGSSFLFLMK